MPLCLKKLGEPISHAQEEDEAASPWGSLGPCPPGHCQACPVDSGFGVFSRTVSLSVWVRLGPHCPQLLVIWRSIELLGVDSHLDAGPERRGGHGQPCLPVGSATSVL